MRKLASIRKISNIAPIEGADAIQVASVDGWKVVVKKNEYQVGDIAVYLEIDSWVPNSLAPFLSKGNAPREYNSVKGERLRTVKLRGQISQGLLLPVSVLPNGLTRTFSVGDDVTEELNIQKWEMPVSASLQGLAAGAFPSFIPKTDQERIQNYHSELQTYLNDNPDAEFETTIKLDGSSMTVYMNDGQIGVCSRNLELKMTAENDENTYVKTANSTGLVTALRKLNKNYAVQGELMGPKIQCNREELSKFHFFVFDIYDIDAGKYLDCATRKQVFDELKKQCDHHFDHVPVIDTPNNMRNFTVDDFLQFAEGKSFYNPVREGVVFKSKKGDFSFKAISNKFLLQQK